MSLMLTIPGVPAYIVYVAIGALMALIIALPLVLRASRNSKKVSTQIAAESTRQAHSERIKSDIIISAIEDGVIVVGADQIIQVFNQSASNLTGWQTKEAEGLEYRSVFKMVDSKGQPVDETHDPLSKTFRQRIAIRDDDVLLVTKSGRQLPIGLSVSPLLDANKEVSAVVGIFHDVTEERKEEEQRADFISTASHEMRTPVAAIEGYLELALNDKVSHVDDKARSYLEKARTSTQSLGKLFQDLLTSAKAEDGRLVSHPIVIDMGSFLEQLADGLRFAASKKGLDMELLIGSEEIGGTTIAGNKNIHPVYYTHADPDRLREVIINLFDNAAKYTDEGKITLALTGDNATVQFFVRDTGPGMAPEDTPHLFQKFYRVDNSSTRTVGGTGLGLFICRKIIELYQGKIWVESTLGEGTTFYVNLPRLDAQKAADLQRSEALQTPSPLG